tara:strand:+ start:286 stop:483 length:198 start_codon:yes stop_codon:yes gene_type:complete
MSDDANQLSLDEVIELLEDLNLVVDRLHKEMRCLKKEVEAITQSMKNLEDIKRIYRAAEKNFMHG